jgi:hypothetical protein
MAGNGVTDQLVSYGVTHGVVYLLAKEHVSPGWAHFIGFLVGLAFALDG